MAKEFSVNRGKTKFGTMMANRNNESVNEGVSSADMDKIKGAVEAAKSFMNVGSELKKLGMKYTFATEPLPIYIIQPTPNNRVAIVNKKYVTKPDFVVGDIAVGIMESKSVNEAPNKLKHTISKKEWSKIPKYNKHIGMDGVHYIMKYDDKIGTYLQGVEIVDESVNEAAPCWKGYKQVGIMEGKSVTEATHSDAPGQWVGFLSNQHGKKLMGTLKSATEAKKWLTRNQNYILSRFKADSVGIMTKKQWDEREAKYAFESINERHWDDGTSNPKVKVGDTFDDVANTKKTRNKVVYVSKDTGAFVVQKVSELGVAMKQFHVFRKEGSDKLGGSLDMTTDLSDAKRKADSVTGTYGYTHKRNESVNEARTVSKPIKVDNDTMVQIVGDGRQFRELTAAIDRKTGKPIQKFGFDRGNEIADSKEELIAKLQKKYGKSVKFESVNEANDKLMKVGSTMTLGGNNLLKPVKMKLVSIDYLPKDGKYSYKFQGGGRTQYYTDDVLAKKLKESVNEVASRTAMEIGALTGTNKDFIQNFVDKNELDIEKVFQYVKKGKFKDRMDFVTAVAGKPNNPFQVKLIKQFKK
jgi:hypothetical protein